MLGSPRGGMGRGTKDLEAQAARKRSLEERLAARLATSARAAAAVAAAATQRKETKSVRTETRPADVSPTPNSAGHSQYSQSVEQMHKVTGNVTGSASMKQQPLVAASQVCLQAQRSAIIAQILALSESQVAALPLAQQHQYWNLKAEQH